MYSRSWVALLAAFLVTPAFACSICRCGDPTFNALGKEGVAQTGLRFAFDWDQVKKTQGVERAEFDSLREQRTTALVAYGISDRLGLFARLPYSERELTESVAGESEHARASGLADPEIYGQVRLWSSPFEGAVGVRASLYGLVGVKTDWGRNDLSRGGARLDEHLQPGTGSTDWFGGFAGSYQLDARSALFASVHYRIAGRNTFGYRYGDVGLANVAYERKLAARWDAALEANYRHSSFDRTDFSAASDPNTGGHLFYVTPRVLFAISNGWVVRAAAQIPLSQAGLNGAQREKTVLNLGFTRLFPAR